MFKKNGRGVESVVESVMEELQKRGDDGAKVAGGVARDAKKAVKDADLDEKVERILSFIEDNATVVAKAGRRLAGDVASEAPGAVAAVGDAVGHAAETGFDAAGNMIETIGKEVIHPTVRYGKGLRHGLFIGAVIAILYTPWPGRIAREKLMGLVQEGVDLVDAMRQSGPSTADTAGSSRA